MIGGRGLQARGADEVDPVTHLPSNAAVDIRGVRFAYKPRRSRGSKQTGGPSAEPNRPALDYVDLSIDCGEVFGLLGPNGGGKTTLFRILSTSLPIQTGDVAILGFDLRKDLFQIRRRIGVVFQSPSLDKKLSVRENLLHHARLYGLHSRQSRTRIAESLRVVGLADRADSMVETLSGGLARRAEIAKSLLHRPELLILDEPSTGLDPAARADLWRYLSGLPDQGVTVLSTTHLMEEAERCSRVAILDRGRIVGLGRPDELRAEIGGEVVTIGIDDAPALADRLRQSLGIEAAVTEHGVRFEQSTGYNSIPAIVDLAGPGIRSISVARPTLEDVFLKRTGHRFWMDGDND